MVAPIVFCCFFFNSVNFFVVSISVQEKTIYESSHSSPEIGPMVHRDLLGILLTLYSSISSILASQYYVQWRLLSVHNQCPIDPSGSPARCLSIEVKPRPVKWSFARHDPLFWYYRHRPFNGPHSSTRKVTAAGLKQISIKGRIASPNIVWSGLDRFVQGTFASLVLSSHMLSSPV